MSKTPFELRFDALCLARDHLGTEYEAALKCATLERDDKKRQEIIEKLKYPSFEELYRRAGEIKNFIDDKQIKKEQKLITDQEANELVAKGEYFTFETAIRMLKKAVENSKASNSPHVINFFQTELAEIIVDSVENKIAETYENYNGTIPEEIWKAAWNAFEENVPGSMSLKPNLIKSIETAFFFKNNLRKPTSISNAVIESAWKTFQESIQVPNRGSQIAIQIAFEKAIRMAFYVKATELSRTRNIPLGEKLNKDE